MEWKHMDSLPDVSGGGGRGEGRGVSGNCPQCHAYNECACESCIGRNGRTGREAEFTPDGNCAQCWHCGWIGSADQWLDANGEHYDLGRTLGVYEP